MTISSRPAGATLKSAREQAAAILVQVQTADRMVGLLGQQYNQAKDHLASMQHMIQHTQQIVAQASVQVAGDQTQLKAAAISYYINNGAVASENPLFTNDESSIGAANVYNSLAEGNITSTVAALKNNSILLTQQRQLLASQWASAAQATRTVNDALRQAAGVLYRRTLILNHLNGAIAAYVNQIQADQRAQALAEWNRTHPNQPTTPGYGALPPNTKGAIAVDEALKFIGVPYVWGGASRYGVDCSGLVMLAWRAAGVDLPHYSGAMYDDTVRIPIGALEPGDLLFYGWHGDEHVTIYYKDGLMIEAPYTGSYVHITPVRFGYGFAGAGRVR